MKSTSFINLFVKQNNMEHFTEKTMILKGCNMTNSLQGNGSKQRKQLQQKLWSWSFPEVFEELQGE